MTPEKIIKALIEANTSVTSLTSTRLYDATRPEDDALPAVVWELISDIPEPPFSAATGTQPTAARVQVNALAKTVAQAKQLAEYIWTACHLKSGSIAGATVIATYCDRGPTSYDQTVDIYQQPIDVLIHYMR